MFHSIKCSEELPAEMCTAATLSDSIRSGRLFKAIASGRSEPVDTICTGLSAASMVFSSNSMPFC